MGVSGMQSAVRNNFGQACSTVSARDPAILNKFGGKIDYVWIDFNAMIHNSNSPKGLTSELVIRNVLMAVKNIIETLKPKKMCFIALDGTAPSAKAYQQRVRRVRSVHDNEVARTSLQNFYGQIEETYQSWQRDHPSLTAYLEPMVQKVKSIKNLVSRMFETTDITAGTKFMHDLEESVVNFLADNLEEWKKEISPSLNVLFSPCSTPGEGEQKIINTLRNIVSAGNYKDTHVLVGSDGDFITLGLLSNCPGIFLMRDAKWFSRDLCTELSITNFDVLKSILLTPYQRAGIELTVEKPVQQRIFKDIGFLLLFCGCDFFHEIVGFDAFEITMEYLIATHCQWLRSNALPGGVYTYITNIDGSINRQSLSSYLTTYLVCIQQELKYDNYVYKRKSKLDKDGDAHKEVKALPFDAMIGVLKQFGSSHKKNMTTEAIAKVTKNIEPFLEPQNLGSNLERVGEWLMELQKAECTVPEFIQYQSIAKDPGTFEYHYYQYLLTTEHGEEVSAVEVKEHLRTIAKEYIEGLEWVLYYYSNSEPYTWNYRFSTHWTPPFSYIAAELLEPQTKQNITQQSPNIPCGMEVGIKPHGYRGKEVVASKNNRKTYEPPTTTLHQLMLVCPKDYPQLLPSKRLMKLLDQKEFKKYNMSAKDISYLSDITKAPYRWPVLMDSPSVNDSSKLLSDDFVQMMKEGDYTDDEFKGIIRGMSITTFDFWFGSEKLNREEESWADYTAALDDVKVIATNFSEGFDSISSDQIQKSWNFGDRSIRVIHRKYYCAEGDVKILLNAQKRPLPQQHDVTPENYLHVCRNSQDLAKYQIPKDKGWLHKRRKLDFERHLKVLDRNFKRKPNNNFHYRVHHSSPRNSSYNNKPSNFQPAESDLTEGKLVQRRKP